MSSVLAVCRPVLPLLALALAAVSAAPPPRAQSFQGLGDLPGGSFRSEALGVSASGAVVVGWSHSSNGFDEAFRWENGAMQGLGDFPEGNFSSRAHGVSADGGVAVGSGVTVVDNLSAPRAARWAVGGVIQNLGALPPASGVPSTYLTRSFAFATSSDGSVVVGQSDVGYSEPNGSGSRNQAFRWTAGGGIQPLGYLAPGLWSESVATGVSGTGAVVVGRSGSTTVPGCTNPGPGGCTEAFRWENGVMQGLGVLGGGPHSQANAISSDGRVIVGWSTSTGAVLAQAFRWQNGIMEGLGALTGDSFSEALAASADGAVIVGYSSGPGGARAFIWTATAGMRNLRAVLEAEGVDLPGWALTRATGVSADGSVIVGVGTNPSGQTEAWRAVVRPTEDIVVNVTGDEPNHPESQAGNTCDVDRAEAGLQCTLRAAIQLANARGGARITFDLPGGGVPRIDVPAATLDDGLPAFTAPITLDGTTQPGGWVELVGPGVRGTGSSGNFDVVGDALRIGPGAGGSVVRGLVVNRFWGAGIRILAGADGCLIEGNRIGTDITGTQALGTPVFFLMAENKGGYPWRSVTGYRGYAGVQVESSGNTIQDNVIAGNANIYDATTHFAGGIDVMLWQGTQGNVVRRNRIGVGADGAVVRVYPAGYGTCCDSVYAGVLVRGSNHVIGGEGADGNILAGHTHGVLVLAPAANVVTGNTIGQGPDGDGGFPYTAGLFLAGPGSLFGDADAPAGRGRILGNTVRATGPAALLMDHYDLLSNTLHGMVGGWSAPPPGGASTFHLQAAVSIAGSDVSVIGNEIRAPGWAVFVDRVQNVVVAQNDIRTDGYGGIRIPDFDDGEPARVLLARNLIATRGMGIDLGGPPTAPDGVTLNDQTDGDTGPNDLLNFPDLYQAVVSEGTVTVTGTIPTAVLTTMPYTVEVYSNPRCATDASAWKGGMEFGPGEHFLGTFELFQNLGYADFSHTLTGLPDGHQTVSLTSSRVDLGVTSEFSRCMRLVSASQVAQATVAPGQTGPVLDAQGAAVAIAPALARGGSTAGHDGGTLYLTRYESNPTTGVFAGDPATGPAGTIVTPDALAARYWLLADRALTPAGGADSTNAATFSVCLNPAGVVLPGALGSVVVVRRSEQTAGAWVAFPTTLVPHTGGEYLCAGGVRVLGEFGIAGAAAAFPVGTEDGPAAPAPPLAFALSAYPNPVRGTAAVTITVPEAQHVSAAVYDLLGRRLAVLHEGTLAAGTHAFAWEASTLPSGVYVVRAAGVTAVKTQRLTIVR